MQFWHIRARGVVHLLIRNRLLIRKSMTLFTRCWIRLATTLNSISLR